MTPDPCDRCVLPDCDDASPRCELRRLANLAVSKRNSGRAEKITEIEAEALRSHRDMLTLEYRARKSERAA